MLTLEQCLKLKEWGFPQDRKGDFWCIDTKDVFFDDGAWAKESPDQYFACPTLEELLEWAKDKFGGLMLHWMISPPTWGATHPIKFHGGVDHNPTQALYKLLEQVLETGGNP